MPWYAWLYLVLLSAIVIAAAFNDLHEESFPTITLDLLEGCCYWVFVVYWYRSVRPDWLRIALPILLVASLAWTAKRAREAVRTVNRELDSDGEPEFRTREILLGVVLGVLTIGPAYAFGFRLLYRLWSNG